MKTLIGFIVGLVPVVVLAVGCGQETPSRDHIPLLKQRVYQLQQAVKAKDRTALDSLLSPEILDHEQSSDSLLGFVYGPDDDFDFQQFGGCEYAYTNDKARINCFVTDNSGQKDRPVVFTFIYRHDLWLLKHFEAGEPDQDSLK